MTNDSGDALRRPYSYAGLLYDLGEKVQIILSEYRLLLTSTDHVALLLHGYFLRSLMTD